MTIYPSIISKEEFNSNAEYKVYQHALGSPILEKCRDCFLFYSVKNPTPGDYKLLGETDFIYLDREIILFIEIKGGQVKYDSLTNKWWVMDGTKEKDPFKQAADNLFDYRDKKLLALFNNINTIRRLIFGYVVFFPECIKPTSLYDHTKRNIEYTTELIVDFNDFEKKDFSRIIQDLKTFWINHESYQRLKPTGLSGQELFIIKNYIRKDIVFEIPWTNILKRNEFQFKRYTDEAQNQALLMLEDNPRMGAIIKGGPGTGKTWLALEYAKKLDLQKKKVLFLCFNKNLASFLRIQIKELNTSAVDIIHKDAFYSDVLQKHFDISIERIKLDWYQKNDTGLNINERIFWNEEIPLKVYQYFRNYHFPKYDFIIMDEAQDYFTEFHMDAISCFLNGGLESGKFLICIDNENQDFYIDNTQEFENYFRTIYPNYLSRLTRNCRNPQKLINTAFFLTGIEKMDCYFKDEVKNSELKYFKGDNDLKNKLLSFVDQKRNEGVSLEKITILCFDADYRDLVLNFKADLFYKVSEGLLFIKNKIGVSTAHAFKGLENHFILFIGPSNYDSLNVKQRKVIYNAFTRAQYQFIYLVNEQYKTIVDSEFATNIIRNHER